MFPIHPADSLCPTFEALAIFPIDNCLSASNCPPRHALTAIAVNCDKPHLLASSTIHGAQNSVESSCGSLAFIIYQFLQSNLWMKKIPSGLYCSA